MSILCLRPNMVSYNLIIEKLLFFHKDRFGDPFSKMDILKMSKNQKGL